jgi:hypothetical protein
MSRREVFVTRLGGMRESGCCEVGGGGDRRRDDWRIEKKKRLYRKWEAVVETMLGVFGDLMQRC